MYGSESLEAIEARLLETAKREGISLCCFQSNSEGELVDYIHKSMGKVDAILINAGAYTHTSIALRDALISTGIPYVELHLSNTSAREDFRQKSLLADQAIGIVSGFGAMSYQLAFDGALDYLRKACRN
ncbi:3-dehydroquinate dehydratase II [Prochlorococcus sp. MIT 0601]|nr:3-dehydroquinate dehydratase II [Prochlorococcus sp. MIT 0601]